jgi:hypothetical protein
MSTHDGEKFTARLVPRSKPATDAEALETAGLVDPVEAIRGRIQGLLDELRTIPPHRFNATKIADRQRGIEILEAQLARIEGMHQRFLDRRAELAARFYAATDGSPR